MSWLNLAVILVGAVCCACRLRFVSLDKAIYLLQWNQMITKHFTRHPHALFSHRCLRISGLICFEEWMSDTQPAPNWFILPSTGQRSNYPNPFESQVATCKTNRRCGFMFRTVLDYESDTAVISGSLGFPATIFCMTGKQLLHMDRRPTSTTIR